MRRYALGVATSLFRDQGFDHFKTVDFALTHSIDAVQLYLNYALEHDEGQIDAIRTLFEEKRLSMIVHSPHFLNAALTDEHHAMALLRLFTAGQRRFVVVHFDERVPPQAAIKAAGSD